MRVKTIGPSLRWLEVLGGVSCPGWRGQLTRLVTLSWAFLQLFPCVHWGLLFSRFICPRFRIVLSLESPLISFRVPFPYFFRRSYLSSIIVYFLYFIVLLLSYSFLITHRKSSTNMHSKDKPLAGLQMQENIGGRHK